MENSGTNGGVQVPPSSTSGTQDEPLREEDVTASDRLDDRVQEGDGLADEDDAA